MSDGKFFLLCYAASLVLLILVDRIPCDKYTLFGEEYGFSRMPFLTKLVYYTAWGITVLCIGYLLLSVVLYPLEASDGTFFDYLLYYAVIGILALIYYGIFKVFHSFRKDSHDKKHQQEIQKILATNPFYQAILTHIRANPMIQSVCFCEDGIAFFHRILNNDYSSDPRRLSFDDQKKAAKTWKAATKKQYSSIFTIGCNQHILYNTLGYDGISASSRRDLCRYLSKDLGFREISIKVEQDYHYYTTKTYSGGGTIQGSTFTYSPGGSYDEEHFTKETVYINHILVAPPPKPVATPKVEKKQEPPKKLF